MADFTMFRFCPHCGGKWQSEKLKKQTERGHIVCGGCGCDWYKEQPAPMLAINCAKCHRLIQKGKGFWSICQDCYDSSPPLASLLTAEWAEFLLRAYCNAITERVGCNVDSCGRNNCWNDGPYDPSEEAPPICQELYQLAKGKSCQQKS